MSKLLDYGAGGPQEVALNVEDIRSAALHREGVSVLDDLTLVQNSASGESGSECEPLVAVPAWWSGFLFHVLNPRQVSMYLYLIMLCDDRGVCHPTIEQIRKDLGLLSTTMVFESIAVLEDLGFFMRSRQALPESRSRRNVYRRTACEYTILRLLETGKIDAAMHPIGSADSQSEDARQLVYQGLRGILGDAAWKRYSDAAIDGKSGLLIEALNGALRKRAAGIYAYD